MAMLFAAVSKALEKLPHRERKVLRLTVVGFTAAEIGEHLGISERCAQKIRERVREKLRDEIGGL